MSSHFIKYEARFYHENKFADLSHRPDKSLQNLSETIARMLQVNLTEPCPNISLDFL